MADERTATGLPGASPLPANAPTYDQWGILNWARDSDRALWAVVPRARYSMIRDAAVRRWLAHYQTRSTLADFLAYADWLHANLDTLTDDGSW